MTMSYPKIQIFIHQSGGRGNSAAAKASIGSIIVIYIATTEQRISVAVSTKLNHTPSLRLHRILKRHLNIIGGVLEALKCPTVAIARIYLQEQHAEWKHAKQIMQTIENSICYRSRNSEDCCRRE
jgi:hypothetical protein